MRSMSCLSNIPGVAVSDDPQAREHARVQRVGFFGFFGIGNFGNDGSLEAMLRLLRNARPATEVLCVCGVPAKVGPRFGVRAVRINWRPESQLLRKLDRLLLNIPREAACLIQAMRHISRLDLLIIPGTGILDDFGTGPKGNALLVVQVVLTGTPLRHENCFRQYRCGADSSPIEPLADEIGGTNGGVPLISRRDL